MSRKVRLDVLLVERGLAESRAQAQRLILSGKVHSPSARLDKPGLRVAEDAEIAVAGPEHPFVSRGGVKLAAALDRWQIDPAGWVCADLGASTGGFTDCLLQRGAVRVYAFDIGRGQLHWRLRNEPRVVVREGVNVRSLRPADVAEPVDLVCIDLSFISLLKVLESAKAILKPSGVLIALVKPQFEVGKGKVGKGGIVRRAEDRLEVLVRHRQGAGEQGLEVVDLMRSPLLGAEGNMEYLSLLVPAGNLALWRQRLSLPERDDPSEESLRRLATANGVSADE